MTSRLMFGKDMMDLLSFSTSRTFIVGTPKVAKLLDQTCIPYFPVGTPMLHILVSTNSENSDDIKLADLALGRPFLHSNGDW